MQQQLCRHKGMKDPSHQRDTYQRQHCIHQIHQIIKHEFVTKMMTFVLELKPLSKSSFLLQIHV